MIKRSIQQEVSQKLLHSNKVIVLLGLRQVGKTNAKKAHYTQSEVVRAKPEPLTTENNGKTSRMDESQSMA